jgi:orotate phosphoribosyltransferase
VPDAAAALSDGLAGEIFDRALLRGTFTLRSGATSDRYFDKYRLTCDPALLGPVAAALAARIRAVAPAADVIVAPALGAVPLAAALSLELALPTLFVRDSSKSYGTNRRIEGTIVPGATAVLIEDVVTSGGAALDALAVAREAELDVIASFCVLDRDGGGSEALAAADAPLSALFGIADMNAAFDAGRGTEVPAT